MANSGGAAGGTHVWPGSLHRSPEVGIPRQASTAVVQLGALVSWATPIEGVHPCSVRTRGAAVRDWTLMGWAQVGAGLMQSLAVQDPSHAGGPSKGVVMPEPSLQSLELVAKESGGAHVPEGVEQLQVPHAAGGTLSPEWP